MLGNYCAQILATVLRGEVLKIIKILLDFSSTFATVKFSKNLNCVLNLENDSSFFSFYNIPSLTTACTLL